MKKTLTIMVCILVSTLAFQSCKSDSKIQQAVQTAISNSYPKVSVTVKDGTATLTGTVAGENEKMQVENAVKSVSGVKAVMNNVVVENNSMSSQSADTAIMNTINTMLRNAGHTDVRVAVQDGVVTLTGDLKRDDLTHVMQIANEAGATRVDNKLNVK